jgi:hypothetical protein
MFKKLLDVKILSKEIYFEKCSNSFSYPENFDLKDMHLFDQNHFEQSIMEVSCKILENVSVSNYFILSGFRFSTEFTIHIYDRKVKFGEYFTAIIKSVFAKKVFFEEGFLGLQEYGQNYYHFITEMLPDIINVHNRYPNLPIFIPSNLKKTSFIPEIFEILGINPTYYDLSKVLKIKKLMVSSRGKEGNFNKKHIFSLQTQLKEKVGIANDNKPYRRIYISRRKAFKRKILNEPDVIQLLKKYDFEVIYAEEYTVKEQIKMLSDCSIMVSSHGAGFTNILFLKPCQSVVELKAHNNKFWMFYNLSKLTENKYYYLLCDSDHLEHDVANISVDLTKLEFIIKETIIKN